MVECLIQQNISSKGGWVDIITVRLFLLQTEQPQDRMRQETESRVQFFNSVSSFGSSSSISSSRLNFEHEQLIASCQNIFDGLKQLLKPRQDIIEVKKLKELMHRAMIITGDSLPQEIDKMNKSKRQYTYRRTLQDFSNRMNTLIQEYEDYQNGKIGFKQFFAKYGPNGHDFRKNKQMDSSKKVSGRVGGAMADADAEVDQQQLTMKQDEIKKVVESSRSRAIREAKLHTPKNSQYSATNSQQIQQLQQQIRLLQKQMKKQQEKQGQEIAQVKAQYNGRIVRIIKMKYQEPKNESNKEMIGSVEELRHYQEQLNAKLNSMAQRLKELELKNEKLEIQNNNLRKQVDENLKKAQIQIPKLKIDGPADFPMLLNDEPDYGHACKKYYQKALAIEAQNKMLKNVITKERDLLYATKKIQENSKDIDIAQLYRKNQQKQRQLADALHQLDKTKVQLIRQTDKIDQAKKQAQLYKRKVERSSAQSNDNTVYGRSVGLGANYSRLDDSRASKTTKVLVQDYIGDGNQHNPYYDFLAREFKIRFKRACLREKELLHKANGLEVGVITNYSSPNHFKVDVFLSNFCDKQPIHNLTIKVSNSKGNDTSIQETQYRVIEMGQQKKNHVTCLVKNYPIGCTLLFCQYEYCGRNEEARILLPCHVFKMLSISHREHQFSENKKQQTFPTESKIGKEFKNLAGYFNKAIIGSNKISSTILHEHTQTKFFYDIEYNNGTVTTTMEHKLGDSNISDYVAKAISFLLRRESSFRDQII